jgi:two-component system response regulator FlrC
MFDDAQMDEQAMPAMTAMPVMASMETALPQAMAETPVAAAPMYFAPIETRDQPAAPIDLDSAVKASELQVIMAAIQSTDSRMEAAAKLGISPRTLRYKLAQMRTRGMNEGVSA